MDTPAVGAYGLRLRGLDGAERLLVEAGPAWPELTVERAQSDEVLDVEELSSDSARLRLRTGGFVTLERGSRTARFSTPRLLSNDEVVHPFLAPAGAVMAEWDGRSCLHAGAFVRAGSTWAVLGEREAGKSSTLAWLALHEHDVLTDDVLVLDGGTAFAGPRAIDLREEASLHLEAGTNLGRIGARDRFRIELRPIEPQLPFAGWVFLTWAETASVRRLRPGELVERLLRQRVLRVPPPDPDRWLELATRPAWELARPRDWSMLQAALDLLFESLA